MRKTLRSRKTHRLANGLISFVNHRLTDVQDILRQRMLSGVQEEEVQPPSEAVPTDSCRWSFHQQGHVAVALALGDVNALTVWNRSCCNPLSPLREKRIEERSELEKRMAILMGGRAAEALFFDDASTLSSEDLREATRVARAMVMRYGMSSSLGLISFETPADHVFPGHSDATARMIDHEVQALLDRAFSKACERLEYARSFLEKTVERLQRVGSVQPEQIRHWWRDFEAAVSEPARAEQNGTETVLMH